MERRYREEREKMTSFDEAKVKALESESDVDTCVETTDAFLFFRKDAPPQDGGGGSCVIIKETGHAVSMSVYYCEKTVKGEEVIEVREFAV